MLPCAPRKVAVMQHNQYRTSVQVLIENTAIQLTFLNVVVRQGATVLKLLSGEDQSLLVRGNACREVTPW